MTSGTAPPVTEIELDGNLVLVRQGDRRVSVLNGTARSIWQAYRAGCQKDELVDVLTDASQVPRAQIEQDVTRLFDEWSERGLLADEVTDTLPFDYQSMAKPPNYPTSSMRVSELTRFYAAADKIIQINLTEVALDHALGGIIQHLEIASTLEAADFCLEITDHEGQYRLSNQRDEPRFSDTLNDAVIDCVVELVELACNYSERLMVMHAGGICKQDNAIVFPGCGGSGKSTLVTLLAARGLTFMGDDVLPVDRRTGAVYGLPIAMCLKSGSWPVIQASFQNMDRLPVYQRLGQLTRFFPPPGAVWQQNSQTRVRAMVFPRWSAGADFELRRIDRTEAFSRLVQSESVFGFQGENLPAVAEWLRGIDAYYLEYSEINQAADAIEKLLVGYDTH